MLPSLGSREGTSRPKSNYIPCLGQFPSCVWRKDVGQKAEPGKCKFLPLHWKKDVLKGPGGSLDTWRYTVCSQSQAGRRLKDMGLRSVRGQQEASVMFGYLSTFLSSCSVKKSFSKSFGSLEASLWHEALSGDRVTASASLIAGWSPIPCLYSHSLLQSLMNYLFFNSQAKCYPLCEVDSRFLQAKLGHSPSCPLIVLYLYHVSLFSCLFPLSDHELLKGYVLLTFVFSHAQAYCWYIIGVGYMLNEWNS